MEASVKADGESGMQEPHEGGVVNYCEPEACCACISGDIMKAPVKVGGE
jgi:hypothetical protein